MPADHRAKNSATPKERQEDFADSLEPGVRDVVLYLLSLGYQTYMSCHHVMYVAVRFSHFTELDFLIEDLAAWLDFHGCNTAFQFDVSWHKGSGSAFVYLNPDTAKMSVDAATLKFPKGQILRKRSKK